MKYKIQIIAPGSACANADAMTSQFLELLIKRGISAESPKNLFADLHFYANTRERRLEQLRRALVDPEVDIIWSFRGGYGSSEIAIQCLDIKPSHNKILIGYSDITVLHGLFNNIYKMPSIHGPGITSILGNQVKHLDDILEILSGKEVEIALKPFSAKTEELWVESTLIGGNLTVITTMTGTKLHPITKGKILLLEDVGEKGYRVRRMLEHLSQAGLFDEVAAVILADFTESDEHLNFALNDFYSYNSHIPVFRARGIGHGKTNIPVIFGSHAIIDRGVLRVSSPF